MWAGRRRVLTSGLLMALGAGLPMADIASAQSDGARSTAPPAPRPPGSPGSLTKGMVSFMLAHEQFSVPSWFAWERLRRARDLTWCPQAIISSLGSRTRDMPARLGSRWARWGSEHSGFGWVRPSLSHAALQPRHRGRGVRDLESALSRKDFPRPRIWRSIERAGGYWSMAGMARALDRLIEAVAIIRGLWTGQPLHHKGAHYTVDGKLYDPPAKPIPLLLAANGPKAMKARRRARRWADHRSANLETAQGEWEQGARSAGRNPARCPCSLKHSWSSATRATRRRPQNFGISFLKLSRDTRIFRTRRRLRACASGTALAEVFADWTVSTDPDAHVQAMKKLFDSGVSIVNIHSGQPDQQKVIEFYGKEVLPRARSHQAAAAG